MTTPLFPIQDYNRKTGELTLMHSDGTITDVDGNEVLTTDERLIRLESTVARILDKMDNVEAMVGNIIAEVKPTIDELMNSQLFKMLGMKKKG